MHCAPGRAHALPALDTEAAIVDGRPASSRRLRGALLAVLPLLLVFACALAYMIAVWRHEQSRAAWSTSRYVCFVAGALLLAIALSPPMTAFAHQDFRGHMVQHLLVGMLAPLLLVLAAPVTLALRMLPTDAARCLAAKMKSRLLTILLSPEAALVLNVGAMYLLYLTPLYAAMDASPALHAFVHYHFLLAGYLFAWAILAGPDRAAYPPSFNRRLFILFIAIAAHAILGKLMYAYGWPRGTAHSLEQLRSGARLMYYGGDIVEVLLLITLFTRHRHKYGALPIPSGHDTGFLRNSSSK